MARTKTTPNPHPSINYQTLYRWAPNSLIAETSKITSFKEIEAYKQNESNEKLCIFEKEYDRFVKVLPYREGVPLCVDDRTNPEEPFFFAYSTIFKRLKLWLLFTGFERAFLTEVNMAPANLHPNNWAFNRAFSILCNHIGHAPSVDVFLYFFEAKNPGKKLWMSFNGAVGRVLLSLFQQSYKGFKGKFFKICCSKFDPTLLDGFPLYWVEKPGLKKPRCLEDLAPQDREVCEFFSNLGAAFSIVELIKQEYNSKALKGYIGTLPFFLRFCFMCYS